MKREILLVLFVIIIVLYGCQNQNNLKVGVILPLTGEMASYGLDCKDGIEISNDINGLNVEYIYEDSKGDPKTAIAAYKKLTTIHNVQYVIGDMFSNTTLAIAPLAKKNEKILVSPTASSRDISQDNIYALSVFPSERYEAKLIADFAKNKYSRIGVLYQKVAAAQVMYDAFMEEIGKNYISCCIAFDSNTDSFYNELHKIRKANCDVIYLITYSNKATQIMTQAVELKMDVDFLGQSALYDSNLYQVLQTLSTQFYLTGPAYNPLNKDEQSVAFTNAYRETYNRDANQMSAQGYVAAIIAHKLYYLARNQQYTSEMIRTISTSFYGSIFSFDEKLCSTSGLKLYEYKDSQFILLK